MTLAPNPDHIRMSQECFATMLTHCQRKLAGESYLPGEDHDRKAFGLLTGRKMPRSIDALRCYPLLHNARHGTEQKEYMDQMMAAHAIPSETPFAERGWVAAPHELAEVLKQCRKLDLQLIGSYHMHRVAWPNDPLRDTPTALDTILGGSSRLWMFIVSLVDPARPLLRAFLEGDCQHELPIHYIDTD